MKFRTDFVTNSSSSSYSVTVGIVLKDGTDFSYAVAAPQADSGDEGYLEMDSRVLENAKAMETVKQLLDLLHYCVSYTSNLDFDEDNEEEEEDYEWTDDPKYVADDGGARLSQLPSYVGLDTRDNFIRKVRAAHISLDDVEKVYTVSTYDGWGEFLSDEAVTLYAEQNNKDFTGNYLTISEKKILNRKTGKISRYIGDKCMDATRLRIAQPGDWDYNFHEQQQIRLNVCWYEQLLDQDAVVTFTGKTFLLSTYNELEYTALHDIIVAAGGTVCNEFRQYPKKLDGVDYLVKCLGSCGDVYIDDILYARHKGKPTPQIVSDRMVETAATTNA